jgi:3-methyladenine DNA glycosylase AlkC
MIAQRRLLTFVRCQWLFSRFGKSSLNHYMQEKFSLKDHLFNQTKVAYLAGLLQAAQSDFDSRGFEREVMSRLLQLELKDRIRWIAAVLERRLAGNVKLAIKHIVGALPPPLDHTKTDNDFGDFIFAPFGEYIVQHGAQRELLKVSLPALRELTMRFSMEDAMRTFLNEFQDETLLVYEQWVNDKNYHVRRLVSESSRPFLPWSKRVAIPWEVRARLLTTLHTDTTRYVTRSVANHLNDEAKVNPNGVIALLSAWKKAGKQDAKELAWMTRHALRTLVKQGNREALALLGFTSGGVTIAAFTVSPMQLRRGEVITLTLELTAEETQSVMIDYTIGFLKANGIQKEKVFKWKQVNTRKGETMTLHKRHHLKADATTFTLRPGEHTVAVQINGEQSHLTGFTLT